MQLEDLVQECAEFRRTKTHRSATFPDALWDKIAQAVVNHGQDEVCRVLSLKASQVEGFRGDLIAELRHKKHSIMVPINNPMTKLDVNQEPKSESSFCELTLTNGTKELKLNAPMLSLPQILPAFAELLNS